MAATNTPPDFTPYDGPMPSDNDRQCVADCDNAADSDDELAWQQCIDRCMAISTFAQELATSPSILRASFVIITDPTDFSFLDIKRGPESNG